MLEDRDITPKILLEHMQGMEQRLTASLGGRMERLENRLEGVVQDLGEVKADVKHIKGALQKLYEKRLEIVERLDRIEEEQLPAIKSAIGLA